MISAKKTLLFCNRVANLCESQLHAARLSLSCVGNLSRSSEFVKAILQCGFCWKNRCKHENQLKAQDDESRCADHASVSAHHKPLYDAMGLSFTALKELVKEGDHVLVTVITDGLENSSMI